MFEDCLEYRIFRQTNLMLYLWLVVSVLPSRTGKSNLAQSYQTGTDDIKKYAWSLGSVYIAWGFSTWFLTDAYQSRTVEKMQSSMDWFKGKSKGNHGFPIKYRVFQWSRTCTIPFDDFSSPESLFPTPSLEPLASQVMFFYGKLWLKLLVDSCWLYIYICI